MTHSIAPFQTNPAAHQIRTGTQALAGWISYLLLLMALAGCRVPSARTDPPTTSCTEPDPPNASAVASPNAAFGCNQMHHGPPGPSEVESVSEYASEGRRKGGAHREGMRSAERPLGINRSRRSGQSGWRRWSPICRRMRSIR